jgi:hypothetical protein
VPDEHLVKEKTYLLEIQNKIYHLQLTSLRVPSFRTDEQWVLTNLSALAFNITRDNKHLFAVAVHILMEILNFELQPFVKGKIK